MAMESAQRLVGLGGLTMKQLTLFIVRRSLAWRMMGED